MKLSNGLFSAGLSLAVGCATLDEDPMAHMDFKSRAVVERMTDDEISVNGADSMAAMKKERKMQIAVSVDISDQSQGNARPPNVEKLMTSVQAFARSFLGQVKGHRLEAVAPGDLNRTLKTGDDINGVEFPFLARLKVILTSETVVAMRDSSVMYKCVLQWELIDNRTKINGLGDSQVPVVIETMTCQNATKRRQLASVTGAAIGGDVFSNAQNAYNEVVGNCMSQFYAQLANRVPFGGVVSDMRTLDGDVYVNIKADARGQGVVKKMQMVLVSEDLDRLAVGEVIVSANGKSSIKVWRWLSKSYRQQLLSVIGKGKQAVADWLDENPIYALCLGLPELPKDMQLDFRSRK
ncbi:MAG: hypothetical protein ACI4RD_00935 [Kiritimatiellia bacterium]